MGDEWGELGTRFSYCAVAALSLLGRLDALNKDLTVSWIAKCKNFDGGFGMVEGAESHAAYGALFPGPPLFWPSPVDSMSVAAHSLDMHWHAFYSGSTRYRRRRDARLVAQRTTTTERWA